MKKEFKIIKYKKMIFTEYFPDLNCCYVIKRLNRFGFYSRFLRFEKEEYTLDEIKDVLDSVSVSYKAENTSEVGS